MTHRSMLLRYEKNLVADLCRRKEEHLHLRSPEKSITRAGIAPLLQKRDAQHLFDEMPKPPGLGPVHLLVTSSVVSSNLILNKLLRLYSRFGVISYACKLFDEITEPNSFLWTVLIHGHVENRRYEEAFSLFTQMHGESIEPLNFTIASVLKALAREGRVKDGETINGLVLKFGFGSDLTVQNAILDLFMRCGKLDVARRIFDQMDEKDVVSWNSMICGYGSNGRVDIARQLFDWMPERNTVSWTSMICGYVKLVEETILHKEEPKELKVSELAPKELNVGETEEEIKETFETVSKADSQSTDVVSKDEIIAY
ncbi:PREDICTED: pentatricopeptide repeat-containing [Prunus dulcis]|uniref:PREDICTED: pentatricopeptide repeat-containing n=1 Tax=Prunus dulcis TaxID=3755 RepID=A0A5E4FDA3_PRUDU|nr:PREDICTED: pentatricopeptide repeat-containing [Prunus dulcis]